MMSVLFQKNRDMDEEGLVDARSWGLMAAWHLVQSDAVWGLMAACTLSCVRLFATPQTEARQVPLSMGFPRQEYWSELPFPPPEDLPRSGIEPGSPVSPALAGFFTSEPPGKPQRKHEGSLFTNVSFMYYSSSPSLH